MLNLYIEHKKHGESFELSQVPIEIKRGEINLLLGHNGAGKTTIIKSLFGLMKFQGTLKISNKLISFDKSSDVDYFKRHVSYISDDIDILDYLSPIEYFSLMKTTYQNSYNDNLLEHLIKVFELEQYLDHPIANLSHGNKKKTQIVSQLFKKSDYIIFDEPTNGLDPDMIIILKDVLKILKFHGVGLLISTHNLSFGQDLFDNLIILRDGHIKLNSNKKEIKKHFSNNNLEYIYKEVNQDYYKNIEGLLNEINNSSGKKGRNSKIIG
ncbi:ABC transporter ATP-binding protein [Bacillus sp. CDB3]|uniref:ATP-binding cassette domain-containing protein n=1 Tax=Bacillus sp. CDB3 TaxID=360310 RepID=UPI0009D7DA5F|nr:ABC transporter ATP-binding protein [Bacillus sp. CDB3]OQR53438.1 ABC transporter ATP-binding protein [Bacillus sp. CDB3]